MVELTGDRQMIRRGKIHLFVLFLLLFPAIFPLFHPGFFPTHDGDWMVIRLSAFHQELFSGQFPVRFAHRLNYGYGYPVFNFLYPLPFYLGEMFYLFLGGFQDAVKAVFLFSIFASALLMYFFLKERLGDWGGLVGAVVYVYTPYRFLNIYVRGSIGESMAFVFPPLIFWSIDKMRAGKLSFFAVAIGAFAYALLITSHNITALLFTPLFLLYFFLHFFFYSPLRKKTFFASFLLFFVFSLSLSCFFWLPALSDLKYVYFKKVVVADFFRHFPTFQQLFRSSWGFGPSIPGGEDSMSFQIGLVNWAVVFLWLFLTILLSSKRTRVYREKFLFGFFFFSIFLLSFFFLLPPSAFIWRILSLSNLVQFPWRVLGLTCLSSACLAGVLITLLPKRVKSLAGLFLLLFTVFYHGVYARPAYFFLRDEAFFITNEGTTTVANEYLPIWVKRPFFQRAKEKVEIVLGEGEIRELSLNFREIKFTTRGKERLKIRINTVFFPGWRVFVDGERKRIEYEENNGLLVFAVKKGQHRVRAVFGETPLRLLANLISGVSFLLLILIIIGERR